MCIIFRSKPQHVSSMTPVGFYVLLCGTQAMAEVDAYQHILLISIHTHTLVYLTSTIFPKPLKILTPTNDFLSCIIYVYTGQKWWTGYQQHVGESINFKVMVVVVEWVGNVGGYDRITRICF